MWVLEAPFDHEKAPYRKFLKPGREYHFGRKAPAELVLADKTISKESATIFVGLYNPTEDHHPPTLTIQALKKVVRIVDQPNRAEWERDRDHFIGEDVPPGTNRLLRSGDTIVLTRSAPGVKVLWLPIMLGVSTKIPKEAIEDYNRDCKLLGICMERSKLFLPNTTHFVLSPWAGLTLQLTQAIMAATHFVNIRYLDELLRRAKLDQDNEDSLQRRLCLPDEKEYFPEDIEIEGMSKPQVAQTLAANERRKTMFVGTTFLFVHGDDGPSKRLDASIVLCKAGKGRVVTENVAKQKTDENLLRLLRRNLSEAQSLLAECGEAASEAPDEGLVVICDNDDIDTDWHTKLVHLTRQMKIAMPSLCQTAISQAIVHADARQYLNQMAIVLMNEQIPQSTNCETLPPTAPPLQNTAVVPAESSGMDLDHDNQHRSSTIQREASPPPTTLPSTSVATSETQNSPRKPKRRAEMVRRDPLEDIFGSSASSSIAATEMKSVPVTGVETPLPAQTLRPSARPRRRDGTDSKRPRVSETWRSIFNMDTNGSQGFDHDEVSSTYGDASQSKTRKYRLELDEADRLATQRATVSREDEGISQAASEAVEETDTLTKKRRAQSSFEGESQPARQRQRQSEEREKDRDESESNEPFSTIPASNTSLANTLIKADKKSLLTDKTDNRDTDNKFLQAIATSKRSKKGLDQFDKEFNLLHLAKPAHTTGHHGKIIADADDPEYRAWEQMGASDFDINAAGNFVQVDFVPLIYHRSEEEVQERARRQSEMMGKWNGKANFKKFRKKERSQRKPMTMEVDEGLDYGLGDGYARVPQASARAATKRIASISDDDEEGIREVELMGAPSKAGSSRKKNSYHDDPFSDDEDEVMQSTAPSRRSTQLTATQQKQRQKTTSPEEERQYTSQHRRAVDVRLDVDADLDDSIYRSRSKAAPPSTSRIATQSGSKRGPLELSSDEDEEGGGFSGFSKKRKN